MRGRSGWGGSRRGRRRRNGDGRREERLIGIIVERRRVKLARGIRSGRITNLSASQEVTTNKKGIINKRTALLRKNDGTRKIVFVAKQTIKVFKLPKHGVLMSRGGRSIKIEVLFGFFDVEVREIEEAEP